MANIPQNTLSIWVITCNPSDYPDSWVARRCEIGCGTVRPTAEHFVHDTLDQARAAVPPGMWRLPRHATDDPVIVESWI